MGRFSNNKDSNNSKEFKDKVEQRAQEIADAREDAERESRERRKDNKAIENIIRLKQLFPVIDSGYGLNSYWYNGSTMPIGLYIALNYLEYQYKNTVGLKEFCSLVKSTHALYNLRNIHWYSVIEEVKNSSDYLSYKTKLSICKTTDKESVNTNTELVSGILKDHLVLADLGLFDEIKDGAIVKLTKDEFLSCVFSAIENLLMTETKLLKPDKITKLYGLLIFESKDFDFEQVKSELVEQCYNNISNNNKCNNSNCNCKQ